MSCMSMSQLPQTCSPEAYLHPIAWPCVQHVRLLTAASAHCVWMYVSVCSCTCSLYLFRFHLHINFCHYILMICFLLLLVSKHNIGKMSVLFHFTDLEIVLIKVKILSNVFHKGQNLLIFIHILCSLICLFGK